jgi:hypothetical protein
MEWLMVGAGCMAGYHLKVKIIGIGKTAYLPRSEEVITPKYQMS